MRWGGEPVTALVLSSAWNNDVLLIDKINAFFLTFYVFGYCLRTLRVIRVSVFCLFFVLVVVVVVIWGAVALLPDNRCVGRRH